MNAFITHAPVFRFHLPGKVTSHPTTKGMTHKSAGTCTHFKVIAHEDFEIEIQGFDKVLNVWITTK